MVGDDSQTKRSRQIDGFHVRQYGSHLQPPVGFMQQDEMGVNGM